MGLTVVVKAFHISLNKWVLAILMPSFSGTKPWRSARVAGGDR